MNRIVKIYWNRVNLVLETEREIEGEVFLESGDFRAPLSVKGNSVNLNIINVSEGDMLESGEFFFSLNGERLSVSEDVIKALDDFSRSFKYRKGQYALLIDFKIDENKALILNADYMMKNRRYKKNFRLAEGEGIKGKIGVLIKIFIPWGLNALYKLLRIFSFSGKKRILFYSENGNEPIGNLKYLYEYMKKNEAVKVKEFCFNLHRKKNPIELVIAVIKIAFSDIVVVDNYVAVINSLSISKKQKIVQLWHAGVGFKSVGYARFGKDGGAHPFKSSHRKYDLAIVDDEKLIDVYKEVFGAKEDIFRVYGMPRLDGYFNKTRIDEVTQKLFSEKPALRGKKIVLFSPTYRGVTHDDAYYDYNKIDLNEIFRFCKENDFCFVIKMHPFIKEKIGIPEEYKNLIIDCSDYDINDLIYISDIMITDYSSCAYEFSFFRRPLIFYRFDKIMYEYERPVHTLDAFSEKQFEVTEFGALMEVLESLRDVDIEKRFESLPRRQENICSLIEKEILGD